MGAEAGGSGATLTVGPTSGGMVRILIEENGTQTVMDFEPSEAEEIADELRAAAERARAGGGSGRGDGGRR